MRIPPVGFPKLEVGYLRHSIRSPNYPKIRSLPLGMPGMILIDIYIGYFRSYTNKTIELISMPT